MLSNLHTGVLTQCSSLLILSDAIHHISTLGTCFACLVCSLSLDAVYLSGNHRREARTAGRADHISVGDVYHLRRFRDMYHHRAGPVRSSIAGCLWRCRRGRARLRSVCDEFLK